jgi:hypothetical protein
MHTLQRIWAVIYSLSKAETPVEPGSFSPSFGHSLMSGVTIAYSSGCAALMHTCNTSYKLRRVPSRECACCLGRVKTLVSFS